MILSATDLIENAAIVSMKSAIDHLPFGFCEQVNRVKVFPRMAVLKFATKKWPGFVQI